MSTSMALLGLLSLGPRHGYELKRSYDQRFPSDKPLAFGQVYSTLNRLSRGGLITVDGLGSDGGPERIVYGVTESGMARVSRWLTEPEPPTPNTASAMFMKVVIALLSDGPAAEYLQLQKKAHMARMRELTAKKRSGDISVSEVVSADYAIEHLTADLRWMDTTAARLADLAEEIRR